MGSSGDDIKVPWENEGVAAVRKRPGIWVGTVTSSAAHRRLLEDALFTALWEGPNRTCKRIRVTLHADRSVEVEDDGPGLPLNMSRWGLRLAEILMTASPSARRVERSSPGMMEPDFEAGLVAVNALSAWLQLEVRREGQLWRQRYEFGKPLGPLVPVETSGRTGTRIRYRVDPTLIPAPLRVKNLQDGIRRLAAEVPGVSFSFHDERAPKAP
jgi:DNA gyrase/topoisomerase IV subunit B